MPLHIHGFCRGGFETRPCYLCQEPQNLWAGASLPYSNESSSQTKPLFSQGAFLISQRVTVCIRPLGLLKGQARIQIAQSTWLAAQYLKHLSASMGHFSRPELLDMLSGLAIRSSDR